MNRINGTSPLARYEIASGVTIEPRDIVALNGDGKAVPAADTAGLKVIGVAAKVDADGVEVESGIYSFTNDTTHAVTRAARGTACYIKDKATVTATGTNGHRPRWGSAFQSSKQITTRCLFAGKSVDNARNGNLFVECCKHYGVEGDFRIMMISARQPY